MGELSLKYGRGGVDRSLATHDHAQVVFRQAASPAQAPILRWSGSHRDAVQVHSARDSHNGIGGRPQFEQMLPVTPAAERRDSAIGRRDFPIRSHGHVDEEEGSFEC